MNNEIIIGGESIRSGERKQLSLAMPNLYDTTPLNLPVHVINGKHPGPTLCILAAIHGDELNGTEIIRRLLKRPVLKSIRGVVIAVPIVNVYGYLYQDRYLMDKRDLNRCFPGSKKGSLAARLAHLLTTEIISQSDYVIDLHTGSMHRENLPQIRANLDDRDTKSLAEAFNVPAILNSPLRPGSLRKYTYEKKIPTLVYEAGEALRLNELYIRTGLNGILSTMAKLDMVTLKKNSVTKFKPTIALESYWVRAPLSGIFRTYKKLGAHVTKGELLATIGNPTNVKEVKLVSPLSGIIVGKNNLPLVHEGAALFHIACYKKPKLVAEQLEYLHEAFSEEEQPSILE